MKKFLLVFVMVAILSMSMVAGFAMAEAVDAAPVEVVSEAAEQPSVAAGVLLYTVVSLVMWYVIDWVKRILLDYQIPERVYNVILLVLCLAVGLLLAFTFKVDAFVLVSALMSAVVPGVPVIESSLIGYVFGGLFFASGSAVIHEISNRLNEKKVEPKPE